MWTDDGIVIRLPEAVDDIPLDAILVPPDEIEDLVVERLPAPRCSRRASARTRPARCCSPAAGPASARRCGSSASAPPTCSRCRRAIPRSRCCSRRRASACATCSTSAALREVLTAIAARRVHVVPVETRRASPFAQSLLFGWIAVDMYDGDAPLAERRATALALDRDLLRELLGAEELRELLDPEALAQLELELQHLVPTRHARSLDDLHDLLARPRRPRRRRDRGAPTPTADLGASGSTRSSRNGAAIRVRVAGADRVAAAEDAARLRDGLGVAIGPGLPVAFTEPVPFPLDELVARYAAHARAVHGRRGRGPARHRPPTRVLEALRRLEADGRVVVGEFRPGGVDVRVVRRRRAARPAAPLARRAAPRGRAGRPARRSPASSRRGTASGRAGAALDALVDAIEQLQGVAIPASVLERDVLPARVDGYRPAMLDELCAAGELVWVGAGPLGADDGRVRLCFRDRVRLLVPARTRRRRAVGTAARRDPGPPHDGGRVVLARAARARRATPTAVLLNALWDLVWAGEVTNDTFGPLRVPAAREAAQHRRRAGGRRSVASAGSVRPRASGRWSLVAPLLEPATDGDRGRARARAAAARTPRRRHARRREVRRHRRRVRGRLPGAARARGVGAGPPRLVRRGARRRAVRAPRRGRAAARRTRADPTSPTRSCSPRPIPRSPTAPRSRGPSSTAAARPRAAGAYVVLVDGELAAYLERGGRGLLTFASRADDPKCWIEAIVAAHKEGRLGTLQLQRIDDGPARQSPLAPALRAAGFVDGYRGLTLRS